MRGDSLDHPVGEREQRRRNLNAKRLRGSKVDDQFELLSAMYEFLHSQLRS
jgi:hypothetical protein